MKYSILTTFILLVTISNCKKWEYQLDIRPEQDNNTHAITAFFELASDIPLDMICFSRIASPSPITCYQFKENDSVADSYGMFCDSQDMFRIDSFIYKKKKSIRENSYRIPVPYNYLKLRLENQINYLGRINIKEQGKYFQISVTNNCNDYETVANRFACNPVQGNFQQKVEPVFEIEDAWRKTWLFLDYLLANPFS